MNDQQPESITNTLDMTFNMIPAGTFKMGSPETEEGREDSGVMIDGFGMREQRFHLRDEHQHEVTITKPFYMQTTAVTQGQWEAVMGTEARNLKKGPNYPVTNVSWDDAVEFCKKLSEEEGKTYRLPTEAEWEYACRAGTETRWSFGDDETALGDYAWYDKNAYDINEKYAHPVGLKKPNAFGLYDMHGNVTEWCHDYYNEHYYKQFTENDPSGPVCGGMRDGGEGYPERVLRGGSWYDVTRNTRSASRGWEVEDESSGDGLGFRLVRELD